MNVPDHFGLFGLPERFEVDTADLERRYLALSRELHPDKHTNASPGERLAAVQRTTDLNQAYKVLKDEFRRAEHLLHRRGIETTEAAAQDHRATVDQRLLLEVLELREALAEARAAKDRARVEALAVQVRERADRTWSAIRASWKAVDSGDTAPLSGIVTELTSLRYYRRFLEEVAAIEEADGA